MARTRCATTTPQRYSTAERTSKPSPNTSATPTPASPCAPTPTSCPPATNEPDESSTHGWAALTAWTRPVSLPIGKIAGQRGYRSEVGVLGDHEHPQLHTRIQRGP